MKTHLSDDMAQVDLSEAKPKCSNLKPHFKTNSAVCGKVALCWSVLEFCFLTKSGAKTQGAAICMQMFIFKAEKAVMDSLTSLSVNCSEVAQPL